MSAVFAVITYLVAGLYRVTSTHQGVQCDVAVKRSTGDDGWVARTPLNVKTPLIVGVKLVNNLRMKINVK